MPSVAPNVAATVTARVGGQLADRISARAVRGWSVYYVHGGAAQLARYDQTHWDRACEKVARRTAHKVHPELTREQLAETSTYHAALDDEHAGRRPPDVDGRPPPVNDPIRVMVDTCLEETAWILNL